jgi:hypothetical protein
MTNRPIQPVTDDHLKKNAPIWKRLFSPSMPEWTPMKVSVAVFATLAIVLASLSFIPEQSVRDFSAASVTTPSLEFSNVELAAFDGLTTSIRDEHNRTRRTSTPDKGARIKGTIRNTTQYEIFVLQRPTIRTGSIISLFVNMQISGADYGKTWDQDHGYFLKPNESYNFQLISTRLELGNQEQFDFIVEWKFYDLENLAQHTATSTFSFQQIGTSWAWGGSEIHWKRPFPTYHPEIRIP